MIDSCKLIEFEGFQTHIDIIYKVLTAQSFVKPVIHQRNLAKIKKARIFIVHLRMCEFVAMP